MSDVYNIIEELEDALSDAHAWMLACVLCGCMRPENLRDFQDTHPIYAEAVEKCVARKEAAKASAH